MYVFYDLETTDTDPDFGQILQIGVVVTDDNLNIVQTHSLRARRQPWVVPSPEALLITGITPEQLENPDENSLFEAMRAFDQILRDAGQPVIRAGYNNIRFDEPGVASASHQNLLPRSDGPKAPASTRSNWCRPVSSINPASCGLMKKHPRAMRK